MLDRERIKIFGDLPGLRPKKGDYFTDRNLLFTFQKFRGYLDRVTMTDTMTFHSLPTYSCRIFVEAVFDPQMGSSTSNQSRYQFEFNGDTLKGMSAHAVHRALDYCRCLKPCHLMI